MKKQILLLLFFVFLSVNTFNLYPQCIPDTVNCKDILEPGQICPEVLPDGYLGITYNQTVTILPPSSAIAYEIQFPIVKIKIATIENLPPGITYKVSATELYPDTAYCVLLSGVPTETGTFDISITVIPYVDFLGNVFEAPAVVNDTSVTISVYEPNAIENIPDDEFCIIGNQPNPFSEATVLGFTVDISSQVNLCIYNYLGVLIYSETLDAKPGENFFRFNGNQIPPGCYIYTIVNEKDSYSGKMVKSR
jgi:hypothetical protein